MCTDNKQANINKLRHIRSTNESVDKNGNDKSIILSLTVNLNNKDTQFRNSCKQFNHIDLLLFGHVYAYCSAFVELFMFIR